MSKTYAYECPACGEIFNISQAQKNAIEFDRLRCYECRYIFKASEHEVSHDYYACNEKWEIHHGVLHRGYLSQVEQLIRTPATPLSRVFWSIVVLFFLLLLAKQSSVLLLERYAQNPSARPYLHALCQLTACQLPPRVNFYLIEQVDTNVQLGSSKPGAMQLQITLHNKAQFAQPYPPLQITLSDEKHRIVGRRRYTAKEYLANAEAFMPPLSDVQIQLELIQPHEKAVSIQVEVERS